MTYILKLATIFVLDIYFIGNYTMQCSDILAWLILSTEVMPSDLSVIQCLLTLLASNEEGWQKML